MREICTSGSEGGGAKSIVSPYPHQFRVFTQSRKLVDCSDPFYRDAKHSLFAPVFLVIAKSREDLNHPPTAVGGICTGTPSCLRSRKDLISIS